jgi:hypothetical protein
MVTNSFGNRNFMQPMERLSMHSWRIQFFSLGGWRERQGFFFFFPCSQCVPQDVPNSTWVLSHMVCPKFNSPIYKLKRWNPGVHICFYLQVAVWRGASIGGMLNVPKKMLMGQSIWLLFLKRKKSCECTHDCNMLIFIGPSAIFLEHWELPNGSMYLDPQLQNRNKCIPQ